MCVVTVTLVDYMERSVKHREDLAVFSMCVDFGLVCDWCVVFKACIRALKHLLLHLKV